MELTETWNKEHQSVKLVPWVKKGNIKTQQFIKWWIIRITAIGEK